MRIATAAAALLLMSSLTALAAPIPPEVEAMLRTASADGDAAKLDTVAGVAKSAYPQSAGEIDELVAGLKATQEARRTAMLKRRQVWEGWRGQGEAGAFRSTGNTDEIGAVVAVNLERKGLRWNHQLDGIVDYLKTEGDVSRARYAAGYNTEWTISNRTYLYGLLRWERDTFAGYTRRFTEGAGLGYRVLEGPEMFLSVEAGPAFRQTRYTDGLRESQTNIRLGADYRWQFWENVAFTEEFSTILGGDNNTVFSTSAFTAKLRDDLSARLSYVVRYESDPPEGLENTDTTTRVTLVYDF